jgi:hypothetical protein
MSLEMAPKSAESNIHTPYALRSVAMSYLVLNVVACGHQMNQCTTRQNSPSQPAEEQVKTKDRIVATINKVAEETGGHRT